MAHRKITERQFDFTPISKIEVVDEPMDLIDIEVDSSDHLFFVSENGASWCLTHNSEPPDIDVDFSDRDKLVTLLKEEMGDECVIPITNFLLFQLKSLVKDISKFYGIDFDEVNEVTSKVEDEVRPHATEEGQNKALFQLKYDDCMKWSPRFKSFIEKYPHVGEHIKSIYKNVKSLGRHASGVIIAEDAEGKMPLINVRGELQTPWPEGMNIKLIESVIGIPKCDLLGLDTLRMIHRCIENILKKNEDIKSPTFADVQRWYDAHLKPGVIDEADPKVFDHVFGQKRFAGIFQFTAKHTQQFIHDFNPKNVDDLAQATAIYRPGPLAAKVDKLIIDARRNDTCKLYDHPAIDEVLSSSRGYVIFQEQLMALANKLAGMSLIDCDRLRKAILKRSVAAQGKNKSESQVLEEVFIDGAEKNGFPRDKARKLYEDVAAFSSYAFNKTCHKDEKLYTYDMSGSNCVEKRIEDVIPGDYVRSRDETTKQEIYVPVVARHDHGMLEIFEFELDDGRKVRCSKDHKFRTKCGKMLPIWQIMKQNLEIL